MSEGRTHIAHDDPFPYRQVSDAPSIEAWNAQCVRQARFAEIENALEGAFEQTAEALAEEFGFTIDQVGEFIEESINTSDWTDWFDEDGQPNKREASQ